MTPSCAARMMAGSARFIASVALLRSPEAIASSTLRIEFLSVVRRDLLISVLRAIWRVALRADFVFAITHSFKERCPNDRFRRCNADWSENSERKARFPRPAAYREPRRVRQRRVMAAIRRCQATR